MVPSACTWRNPPGGFTISTDWTAQLGTGDATNPWVWTGDFNGDGKTDIASYVTGYGGKKLHMNLSTGSGFASEIWYADIASPGRTRIGDFNGDGLTDFASVCYELTNGQPGYRLHTNLSTGNSFTATTPQLSPMPRAPPCAMPWPCQGNPA